MATMRVSLPTVQPELHLDDATVKIVGEKFASYPRPWIVLGIGASDPQRDWPDASWSEFLAGVRRGTYGTVFLIGGSANIARAQDLIDRGNGAPAVNACDLRLGQALALLRRADLFVGNDSGPMNLALAAATPAFALFGVNPVLNYSKFIHPIAPEGGPAPGGMLRISPATVLAQVTPYLASRKQPV